MRRSVAVFATLLTWQALAGRLPAQPVSAEVVAVELSNFKFAPSEVTFRTGRSYRLHLVNAAGGGHDFSAPEFFAASTIAPSDQGKVVDGKVKLSGHQTVDIELKPRTAGVYKLTCTHFMHSGMGMKGLLTVR